MLSLAKYSQSLVVMGRGKVPPASTPTTLRKGPIALPRWAQSTPHSSGNPISPTVTSHGGTAVGNAIIGKSTNEKPIHNEGPDDLYLKWAGLQPERMPKHVMVVLDGNRRWCEKNGTELTYEPFYRRYITLADLCIKLGIPTATCSVFSTCTWKRSDEATDFIFRQFQTSLEDNLEKFTRQGIKVSMLGERGRLPKFLQDTVQRVEEATKNGKTLHMIYHMSYGGRWDILEAARSIVKKAMDGEIEPEDVDEALVEEHLSTGRVMAHVPNPDLMVRCGGKRRFSNFYLWQLAYAELYFSDLLAPDFGEVEFLDALRWFQRSGRRFGK